MNNLFLESKSLYQFLMNKKYLIVVFDNKFDKI
jgi:hypothetical protein